MEKDNGKTAKKTELLRTLNEESNENAYRLARLIRSGNRELERQLNIKKTR